MGYSKCPLLVCVNLSVDGVCLLTDHAKVFLPGVLTRLLASGLIFVTSPFVVDATTIPPTIARLLSIRLVVLLAILRIIRRGLMIMFFLLLFHSPFEDQFFSHCKTA